MTNEKYKKIFEIDGAHQSAGVTCANLAPRSGNVLATGGKDRAVCIWTFSKNEPLMVLPGHQSSVESVQFSWDEHQVAGGSMSGAIKIWDLKDGKIVSTFAGHRGNITCLAHNPFERFLWASGSLDSSAKLWDIRTNQAVNTYKGHSKTICALDFSPDGKWLVTGADDCKIKIWDLVAGKAFAELNGHSGPVTEVQFHPNEYLLASSSQDKTVRFWDLETFECVSQSDPDTSGIQCILFHPSGVCLYSVSSSSLRVIGWEPTQLYDAVPLSCGSKSKSSNKVAALAMIQSKQQLISVALAGADAEFGVFSSDAKLLKPLALDKEAQMSPDPLSNNNFSKSSPGRLRRSFHERIPQKATQQSSTEEDSTSSNSTTSEQVTMYFENVQIETEGDYTSGFHPKHLLKRSPPGTPIPTDPTTKKAAASDLGSTFTVNKPPPATSPNVVRKTSTTAAPPPKAKAKAAVPPLPAGGTKKAASGSGLSKKVVHEVKPLINVEDDEFPEENASKVDMQRRGQQTAGGGNGGGRQFAVCADDFLPNNFPFNVSPLGRHSSSTPSMCASTEEECLNTAERGAGSMSAVLQHRVKSIAVMRTVWKTQGVKSAVDTAVSMREPAVIVDLLNVLNFRSNLWHLDLCVLLLPHLKELLESKYETYVHTAVNSLRLMLRDFGQVIKNGLNIVPSIGVDITQEERFTKCQKCYIELASIRSTVVNKQKLSSTVNAHTYREICLLMQLLDS